MMTAKKTDGDMTSAIHSNPLVKALFDAYKQTQPLLERYLENYNHEKTMEQFAAFNFDPLNVQESYLEFLDRIAQNPNKFLEIQAAYAQDWMHLWFESVNRFMGEDVHTIIEPEVGDRRFKAPEWQESALFDFIKQSYLLTCKHVEKTIREVDGLSDKQKEKLHFQAKLFNSALSPSNFLLTNPEVLNETIKTGGENLVKGFNNLIKDLERGHGELNIRTTNYEAFKFGENIATTKGQVVYQNDLIQLIQYEPKTEKTYKTPLLIVPPWINKYYILDLRAGNSLIEWAVEQGHTVFVISWVNPGAELSQKTFEDYMNEGVLDAMDQVQDTTGEEKINLVGYCLGGTLLATTLAYLASKKQDKRVESATFLTTLINFEHAGDMKLFLDDHQLENLNRVMKEKGVLSGKEVQKTFSLMRANDLIWSFVVNNYLMGREPFPFDLLYWNDDCTNMPAAMHSFYLRNMYRDNKLIEAGGINMNNTPIDLSKVKTPCYFLSTKEDHIAPWKATYEGAKLMGDNVTFTLAASGHIAGVINAPNKNKYCYWTNKKLGENHEDWLEGAKQAEGSWWPTWEKWVSKYSGEKVTARKVKKALNRPPVATSKSEPRILLRACALAPIPRNAALTT